MKTFVETFALKKKKNPETVYSNGHRRVSVYHTEQIDIEWEVLSTNRKVISAREGFIFLITRKLDRRAL